MLANYKTTTINYTNDKISVKFLDEDKCIPVFTEDAEARFLLMHFFNYFEVIYSQNERYVIESS